MANIFILAAFALAAGAAATFMLATMLSDDVMRSSERRGRYAGLGDGQDPSLVPDGAWPDGCQQKQKLCSRAQPRTDRHARAPLVTRNELLLTRWYRTATLCAQQGRTASFRPTALVPLAAKAAHRAGGGRL
jgi:hypothetical protein